MSTPRALPLQRFSVDGLHATVEITIDRWGVPHIEAADRRDIYLAQGFNAARDRLFQIDLWRRRGLGRLAAAFGPEYVEQDRACRLLLYRGDMDAEWAAYGPGVRAIVEQFTAGVNAYISWALAEPNRLPPEFALHHYTPEYWRADDVARLRTHGLFYNAEQEAARVRTLHLAGETGEDLRQVREPRTPLDAPAHSALAELGPELLRTYRLAFAPVSFGAAPDPERAREGVIGSNNWVIGPDRTATGRPLLANDPHRAVTLPSLRYLAHLRAPGLDVIGAGEPGLPGISIGHNERVAFGLTIWPADVEDLTVYRLDPDAPSERYLGPAGSTPFQRITETVGVRGAADAEIELRFTEHGPVIFDDPERGIAVALRAAWLEPGMAPYLGSLGYVEAENGDDFVAALDHWGAPAVNQVYATVDGDWGWQVAARVPKRAGWDGTMPVDGAGDRAWVGLAGAAELPGERRPERGWIATANECNLPDAWRHTGLIATHDWYSDARATRLHDWLSRDDAVSVETSDRMHNDTLSVHALEVLRRLGGAALTGDAECEFAALAAWDGDERADSREALVFQIWVRRHLRPALVRVRLAHDGLEAERIDAALPLILKDESFGGDLRGDLALASWQAEHLAADERSRVFARTLSAAIDENTSLLGPETDDAPWQWGRLHHSAVEHPAFAGARGVDHAWARLGPVPRGGSGDTVGMAGYDAAFRQSIGSTFRMVLDVGEWDRCVVTNSPGQSGDPRSPHYADLFAGWADGESFPLVFSAAAIAAEARSRIVLSPQRASGEHSGGDQQ